MPLPKTLSKVATKLIKKFGRSATLHTVTSGAYDPDNGTSSTSTDTTIQVFVGSYKTRDYNEHIRVGDSYILTTSQVTDKDSITIGTKKHSVTLVEDTPLREDIIVYKANIRAIK